MRETRGGYAENASEAYYVDEHSGEWLMRGRGVSGLGREATWAARGRAGLNYLCIPAGGIINGAPWVGEKAARRA